MSKVCSKCKKSYPRTKKYFYVNKRHKDGLASACKKCTRPIRKKYEQSEKGRATKRKYYHTEKGKIVYQKAYKKYQYGLSLEQHKQLYLNQNGCCAICEISVPYDKMNTDHNHKTGKVRGLLCRSCNTRIAGMDDEEFLTKALEYLNE